MAANDATFERFRELFGFDLRGAPNSGKPIVLSLILGCLEELAEQHKGTQKALAALTEKYSRKGPRVPKEESFQDLARLNEIEAALQSTEKKWIDVHAILKELSFDFSMAVNDYFPPSPQPPVAPLTPQVRPIAKTG